MTILALIDRAPLGRFHYRMLSATAVPWLWAAYGITIAGYVLPSIRAEWSPSPSLLALVASFSLIGMLIGAVIAGTLADRIGRRATLQLAQVIMALALVASGLAWSFSVLLVFRFISGLAFGAILPVASTLVAEFLPSKQRGRLLVYLSGAWGLGGVVAGLVGWLLVPLTGWREPFLLGGLAALGIPLLARWVPESLRFQMTRGRTADAAATTRRLVSDLHLGTLAAEPEPSTAGSGAPAEPARTRPAGLWDRSHRQRTATLWWLWVMLNFVFQGIFIWLPSLLLAEGWQSGAANAFTLIISAGQVPGAFLAARWIESGRRRTLIITLAVFAVVSFLFAFANQTWLSLVWGFLLATANGAAWGIGYPYTTELYPTHLRGRATGWATGVGRLGGVIAPYAVGLMVQSGVSKVGILAVLAAAPLLALLPVILLRIEPAGRSLEEAAA